MARQKRIIIVTKIKQAKQENVKHLMDYLVH